MSANNDDRLVCDMCACHATVTLLPNNNDDGGSRRRFATNLHCCYNTW